VDKIVIKVENDNKRRGEKKPKMTKKEKSRHKLANV